MPVYKSFMERVILFDQCLQSKQKIWTKKTLIEEINTKLDEKGAFDRRKVRSTGISNSTFYSIIKYLRAGNDYVHQLVVLLRSLLPVIEEHGLATAAQLDLDTLAARMDTEAVTIGGLGRGPIAFGVWGRAGN